MSADLTLEPGAVTNVELVLGFAPGDAATGAFAVRISPPDADADVAVWLEHTSAAFGETPRAVLDESQADDVELALDVELCGALSCVDGGVLGFERQDAGAQPARVSIDACASLSAPPAGGTEPAIDVFTFGFPEGVELTPRAAQPCLRGVP